MREFLTGLAILLIGVLFTALIAPFVIDFDANRPLIERQISDALGIKAAIEGPVEIRFLPFPVIRLGRSYFETRDGSVSLQTDAVAVEIATMPLFKGEIHVMSAEFERPLAVLSGPMTPTDAAPVPTSSPASSSWLVAIDAFSVKDGAIRIMSGEDQARFSVTGLDLKGSAGALAGPWKIDGSGAIDGHKASIVISTGAPEADGMTRAKGVFVFEGNGIRADFDGNAKFGDAPHFDGKLGLSGQLDWPDGAGSVTRKPWTAGAEAVLDDGMLALQTVELTAGDDEDSMKLSGTGRYSFAPEGMLALALDARQIDLDRPISAKGGSVTGLPAAFTAWRAVLAAMADTALPPLDLSLSADALLLGGETVRALRLDGRLEGGRLKGARFSGEGPGDSRIAAEGEAGFEGGGDFFGKIRLQAADLPKFGGWVEGAETGRSSRFGDARTIDVESDVKLSPTVFSAPNLRLTLDKSTVTGTVVYKPPEEGARGNLTASLVSEGIDLEQFPDVRALSAEASAFDISLMLDARAVRIARPVGAHAGRLRLKARATADGFDIDTLDISDLGGASVRAEGRLTAAGDRITVAVDSSDVVPLAALASKFVPGAAARLLAARARALSPLKVSVTATRAADAERTIGLVYEGTAAATRIKGRGRLALDGDDPKIGGDFSVAAADPAVFLRQMGLDVLPLPLSGTTNLAVTMAGGLQSHFTIGIKGVVGSATIGADLDNEVATGRISGPVRLASRDLMPLVQAFALPIPDAGAVWPIEGSGLLDWTAERIALDRIESRFREHPVSGALAYTVATQKLEGALSTDQASLPGFAEFLYGPLHAPLTGSVWPSATFLPPAPPPAQTIVSLSAASLDTGFGASVTDAKLTVLLQEDALEIKGLQGAFLGGRIEAGVTLKRQGGLGSYLGHVGLSGVPVAALLPGSGISGAVDLTLDGGGSGGSLAAFAASFSGGGQARIASLNVPGFDVAALPQAAAAIDAEANPPDLRHVRDMVAAGLLKSPLSLASMSGSLTASSGLIRFGPLEAVARDVTVQGNAALDIKALKFEGKAGLTATVPPPGWTDVAPQAAVTFKGPVAGPVAREVDVAALASLLTTRAVARELARIEESEADLREMKFFSRRLKLERDAVEAARKAAEEARLAEEARKKADEARIAEEARKKAEEARLAEDARKKAEEARLAEEVRKKAEEARLAEEARKKAEEARLAEEARKKAEDEENRKIIEDLARQKAEEQTQKDNTLRSLLDSVNSLLNAPPTVIPVIPIPPASTPPILPTPLPPIQTPPASEDVPPETVNP